MPTKLFCSVFIGALAGSLLLTKSAQASSLAGTIIIPGDSTDLSGQPNGPNGNRLGGFFSDLYYDRANNVYYGLSDRGPVAGRLPTILGYRNSPLMLILIPEPLAISTYFRRFSLPRMVKTSTD